MNKLEKGKLDEIEKEVYNVNAFISMNYIGLKRVPTEEELFKLNDILARCIRRLRDMQL
jgi:hypothetical protein